MATTIRYTVQACEILGQSSCEEYDMLASARAYGALLETALTEAYPDATVDVRVERTSGGRSLQVSGDDEDAVLAGAHEIAGRIWEGDASWLVPASD